LSRCRSGVDQGDGHAVRLDLAHAYGVDLCVAGAGCQQAEGANQASQSFEGGHVVSFMGIVVVELVSL
jgi:hypothetical protein